MALADARCREQRQNSLQSLHLNLAVGFSVLAGAEGCIHNVCLASDPKPRGHVLLQELLQDHFSRCIWGPQIALCVLGR